MYKVVECLNPGPGVPPWVILSDPDNNGEGQTAAKCWREDTAIDLCSYLNSNTLKHLHTVEADNERLGKLANAQAADLARASKVIDELRDEVAIWKYSAEQRLAEVKTLQAERDKLRDRINKLYEPENDLSLRYRIKMATLKYDDAAKADLLSGLDLDVLAQKYGLYRQKCEL